MNKNEMPKQFSYKITWLNLIASVIIVIGHCNTSFSSHLAWRGKKIIDYLSFMGIPMMGYFFFVSAYLFFRTYKVEDTVRKWKSRCRTLIVPYILWNALMIGSEYIRGQFVFSMKGVLNAFTIPPNGPINGPLWYIVKLYVFFVFAPGIYFLMRQRILAIITIIFLFCINCITVLDYYSVIHWTPIFFLGAYISINCPDVLEKEDEEAKKIPFWLVTIFFLLIVWVVKYICNFVNIGYMYKTLVPLLILGLCQNVVVKKPSDFLKSISFYMYCTHIPVLWWVGKIIRPLVDVSDSRQAFLATMVLYVCVFGVIVISKILLDKYFKNISLILTGNR